MHIMAQPITEQQLRDALREVIDPDVGVNIVDLGLVETAAVTDGRVTIGLVMTTPACPQGSYMTEEAAQAVRKHFGQDLDVKVELLDEPLWEPDRMSAAARQTLGWTS